MGIDPIGCKEPFGACAPEDFGQLASGFERGFQTAIRQAEILTPIELQNGGGGGCFLGAEFRRAVRRWFASGQIQNADAEALIFEPQNRRRPFPIRRRQDAER